MTKLYKLLAVPGNEEERRDVEARAAAVDALWRARNAETIHGFGSAEHRAAITIYLAAMENVRPLH